MKNVFQKGGSFQEMRKAQYIAFVHHKGGTGKTTSCLNIAGWLVKMGKKVLVVDLDPQGNATGGLGIDRNTLEGSTYDVLFENRLIGDIILETDSGIHLAPASMDLLAAETRWSREARRDITLMKEALMEVEMHFDYILIDAPPGSTFLMINGIIASENIIIPMDIGVFSYEALETLKTLILDLQALTKLDINVQMVILRRYRETGFFFDKQTREIKELVQRFMTHNEMHEVRMAHVPFSAHVYTAQMKGKPISHCAPWSDVGRAYKKIAKAIATH